MEKIILEKLIKIVQNLTNKSISLNLTIPKEQLHGDFTTNIALQLSKELKRKPFDIAQEIITQLGEIEGVEKIEPIQPGFINFYLTKKILLGYLKFIKDNYKKIGQGDKLLNKKIIVEFTDPNPFKELHIGHVYDNIIGEALCKLFESQGAEVKRVTYQGDVGLHVAKTIWAILQMKDEMPDDDASLNEKAAYLGKAYAFGATQYEANDEIKQSIKDLNKRIYERDDALMPIYTKGRMWSLEYFNSIYKRLGMQFDDNFFESMVGAEGIRIVRKHIKNGIFVEDQGAIIFKGEKYGLHTRVFINSQGLPTYEAKDLALPSLKYQKFPYDKSIIITAHEQDAYFDVMLMALKQIQPDLAAKTEHLSHGVVRLPEGKMSSRTGKVITAVEVLDKAKQLAEEKITEPKFSKELTNAKEILKIAEEIGVGAIKYSFLKSSIGRDIPFNFQESVSFDGNAGPYLQYTYTRTQSVLEKAGEIKTSYKRDYLLNEGEKLVLRHLYQFSAVVEIAALSYSPHMVVEYLFILAQEFNLFYQKYRILNTKSKEEKTFRILLTQAVGIIIKQGLYLLGIAAPERM
jgi:arginyl-tRNA synthetase